MDNDCSDKNIGRQICFSDDLTKIHRHKNPGEILREYAAGSFNGSNTSVEDNKLPKKLQLELTGTEPDDRLDRKMHPRDAIKTHEFDQRAELPKNLFRPTKVDAVNGVYIMDEAEKQRLEEERIALYACGQ
jgi:hypothetical protein